MKQNQIQELEKLSPENFENIFNVYQNENGTYYYNLLQTVEFPKNLPANLFTDYFVAYGDTWPYISFKNYKTPNLWWIILLANNIENPTIAPSNGSVIKIPLIDVVKQILSQTGK